MNRKKIQSELIFKLGLVFSPLQDIVSDPDSHDADSRARLGAKFFADLPKLESEFLAFTGSEPGHNYRREWRRLHGEFHTLASGVEGCLDNPQSLSALLGEKAERIVNEILSIPVTAEVGILEAQTPFSTYCLVKSLCQTVSKRLIWVDRYFHASLFHRYLEDVPTNVDISLLTWPNTKRQGNKNAREFAEFMDVAKLFAAEREPTKFRIVAHSDIHDRWLCCDSQIYQLGGSIKDIGKSSHFTLSKVPSTNADASKIEDILITGQNIIL